jgi:hypothetical protein
MLQIRGNGRPHFPLIFPRNCSNRIVIKYLWIFGRGIDLSFELLKAKSIMGFLEDLKIFFKGSGALKFSFEMYNFQWI